MKTKTFVIVVIFSSFAFFGLGTYLDRPEMYVSESGECLSAVGPKGAIPCSKIKKADWSRYDKVTQYQPPK